MDNRIIKIFDTTMRDGEQTPGIALGTPEKLEIAQALARLKVDVIEAGFPITSNGDFEAVKIVSERVKGPTICALARPALEDIECAREALKAAESSRIHVFIATSDIHLEYKLKMNRQQVMEAAEKGVALARKYCGEVEFSAEDATRSDWDYLCQIYEKAIAAGATIINVPDTVGYTTPSEYAALIRYLKEKVSNIDKAVISVHCHDDLGLAVANSLAAIEAGAGQVECTINGLGERAGNASMEEIVMALATRGNHFKAGTHIDTQQIYRTSRLVSSLTGVNIHPTKAIVGENAFAHESGIHQHGVLNNPLTYEIMTPETVGIGSNSIVLGKHSGRHAFSARLTDMGYEFDQEKIEKLFVRFKELADHKKNISDRDLEALVSEKAAYRPEWFRLVSHQEHSSNNGRAIASVVLESSSGQTEAVCFGEGPVDAVYNAVDKAVGFDINLTDFQIKAVTGGVDALGESTVLVERDGKKFYGRGLSTNIIEASVRAYINAINSMIAACGFPGLDKD